MAILVNVLCNPSNILTELIAEAKKHGYALQFFQRDNWTETENETNAVYFSLINWNDFSEKVDGKLPKKYDLQWFLNKLESKKQIASVNYKKLFVKLPKIAGHYYTTTYGFGVEVIFSRFSKSDIEAVKNWLDKNGIEYITEFSDAKYVYRFRISKAKNNIAKLNALTK